MMNYEELADSVNRGLEQFKMAALGRIELIEEKIKAEKLEREELEKKLNRMGLSTSGTIVAASALRSAASPDASCAVSIAMRLAHLKSSRRNVPA